MLADGRVLQVTLQSPKETAPPAARQAPASAPALPSGAGSGDGNLPMDVRCQLAEAEARYLKEKEQIMSRGKGAAPKTPKGAAPAKAPATLKDRLGSLPLAQRLAASGPAPPQSAAGALSRSQKRKQALRQKKAMDLD